MSDLIRRKDAVREMALMLEDISADLCEDILTRFGYDTPQELATEAMSIIPSADRPQGKWIRNRYWSRGVGMGEEYGFFYKCSLCKYEVEDGYTRCNFNYCPHCGARMFAKDINVPNKKGAEDE